MVYIVGCIPTNQFAARGMKLHFFCFAVFRTHEVVALRMFADTCNRATELEWKVRIRHSNEQWWFKEKTNTQTIIQPNKIRETPYRILGIERNENELFRGVTVRISKLTAVLLAYAPQMPHSILWPNNSSICREKKETRTHWSVWR